jgi:hypothetical protein
MAVGKYSNDTVLDQALNFIKNNANKMTICEVGSSTPDPNHASAATYYTYANSKISASAANWMMASVAMSSADYTLAAGDSSGRKVTVGAQSSISIDGVAASSASHSADGVFLLNTTVSNSGPEILYVTTCTKQSLTGGNKVNVPAWDIEIRDPS